MVRFIFFSSGAARPFCAPARKIVGFQLVGVIPGAQSSARSVAQADTFGSHSPAPWPAFSQTGSQHTVQLVRILFPAANQS
jgi:hypothetical protein